MLISASFAATKLVLGLVTGSLALISEATQNTADFAATAITWWAVRLGDKPADANHPYGHAKVESLAALAEVVLLFTASVWIAYEAIERMITGHDEVDGSMIAIGVLVASIVIDSWRSRVLRQVAKETGSPALEADALNFFSDMLASGVVLIGMGFVALGYPIADALAALVVAGFILFASSISPTARSRRSSTRRRRALACRSSASSHGCPPWWRSSACVFAPPVR